MRILRSFPWLLGVVGLGFALPAACSSDDDPRPATRQDGSVAETAVTSTGDGGCEPAIAEGVEVLFSLPRPPGEFGVARGIRRTIQTTRDEPDTDDANDKRKLSMEIWYPTERCASAPQAQLFDDAEGKALAPKPDGWWKRVRTYVSSGAPMLADGKRHPVLIFSSGYGAVPRSYSVMLAGLVSRGYIVATLSHTHWDGITTFADGTTVKRTHSVSRPSALVAELETWMADQKDAIDFVASLDQDDPDGKLGGRFDLDRLGVFGHSFGGASAVELSARDPRVKGAVDLDGTIVTMASSTAVDAGSDAASDAAISDASIADAAAQDAGLPPLGTPFLIFESDLPPDPTFTKAFDRATSAAYRLRLAQSAHGTFSDAKIVAAGLAAPLDEKLGGAIDALRAHVIIGAYLDAFFAQHLAGRAQPLMQGPSNDYPEITFTKK